MSSVLELFIKSLENDVTDMVAVRIEIAGTDSTEVSLAVRGKIENVRGKWMALVPNLISMTYESNISLLVLVKIMVEQMDAWRASRLGEMYKNVNIINAVAAHFTYDIRKLIAFGVTHPANSVVRAAEELRDMVDEWEQSFPNMLTASIVSPETRMSQAIDTMVTPGLGRLPFMNLSNTNWYKSYKRIEADNELIGNLRPADIYIDTFDRKKTGKNGAGDIKLNLNASSFYSNDNTTNPSAPDIIILRGCEGAGAGIVSLPSVAGETVVGGKFIGVAAQIIPDTIFETFEVGGFTLHAILSVLNYDTGADITNTALSDAAATHHAIRKMYVLGTPVTTPTVTVVLNYGGIDHVYYVPPQGLPVTIYLPPGANIITYVSAGSTVSGITTTTGMNGFLLEYKYVTSDGGSAFINKALWGSSSNDALRLGDLIGRAAVPPDFPTSLDSFLDLVVQYSRYMAVTVSVDSSIYGALQNEAFRKKMTNASSLPLSSLRLDWYFVPSDIFTIEELKFLYCHYLSLLPGVGIAIANDVSFHAWLQKQCA
jgi:CBS domain-containing protein